MITTKRRMWTRICKKELTTSPTMRSPHGRRKMTMTMTSTVPSSRGFLAEGVLRKRVYLKTSWPG
jgi:hypothetical protein